MYIPLHFGFEDQTGKIEFMKRYSFATIVSAGINFPIATHVPFIIEERDGRILLSSHFAARNEHADLLESGTSLIIFSEPHAYISPKLYEKKENVPTWNYIAVHAYGNANILHEVEGKLKVLERMIAFYEPEYQSQWDDLPEKYRTGLVKGITAFEIVVSELQGKKKLSQNRSAIEKENIVTHLEKSTLTVEQETAQYMRNL